MTADEFNKKYEQYLEERHYGLAIDDPEVVDYLDRKFQEFIQVPGFSYSQIKLKFGMARVYCQPFNIPTAEVEKQINQILNGRK